MLKITPIIFGLSISFGLSTATKASTISTKSNENLGVNLLSQFGTTPTYNQRQQETFHRDTSNYLIQLENEKRLRQQAENEKKIRRLALDFTSKRDYIGLGSLYYSNGYMRSAINAYTMAIEANPKNSTVYFLRARVKGDQDNLEGAIADYDIAITLNPQSDGAYINRAVDKFRLKDKNGSLQDFRSAARIYKATGNTADFEDTMRRIRNLFKVPE
jgi:tetratricopeptide (TPR) repeat protein